MALPVRLTRGRAPDPVEMVRHDFGNVLSRFFGGGILGEDGGTVDPLASLANYGVDIREDADRVYIEADLPGFRKEDVDISVEDGTLTISAERQEEVKAEPPAGESGQEQVQRTDQGGRQDRQGQPGQQGRTSRPQQGNYLLRERRVQRFVRSFTLPPNVDEQSAEAKLEDGVLKITLRKREDTKPRRVQVS
jgi:HSP20 family protein